MNTETIDQGLGDKLRGRRAKQDDVVNAVETKPADAVTDVKGALSEQIAQIDRDIHALEQNKRALMKEFDAAVALDVANGVKTDPVQDYLASQQAIRQQKAEKLTLLKEHGDVVNGIMAIKNSIMSPIDRALASRKQTRMA